MTCSLFSANASPVRLVPLVAWMVCGVLALALPAEAQEDIQFRKVFGSEAPGPYKHPAAIEELANGDLYLAYYGGDGEYARDTAVYGSRLAKGSDAWTAPAVIADTPFRSEGNPVIWQAPDGNVWLFYVVRFGDTWSTSRIKAKVSFDGAQTWSDSLLLTLDEGTMVRGQPIALASGKYLLPMYRETGNDTEFVGADTVSRFIEFDPETQQWTETGEIRSRTGNLQPAIVELEPDHLLAFCRRGGGYEPVEDGYVVRSESFDGGKTWTPGEDSEFPNPNSAVDMIKLANGHLLLVYNHNMNERTPLTIAISTDGGKTWPHRRDILSGEGPYAYPYVIQGADGQIHLVYTSHGRTVINVATFAEDAILGHTRD